MNIIFDDVRQFFCKHSFFKIRFNVFELFVKFLKQRKFVRRFNLNIFHHFIFIVYFFWYIIVDSNEFNCRNFFSFFAFFFNFRKTFFSSIFTQFFFFSLDSKFLFEKIDIFFLRSHKCNLSHFRKFSSLSTKHLHESKNERSRLIRKQTKFYLIDLHFSKNAAKILHFLTCFDKFWKMIRH